MAKAPKKAGRGGTPKKGRPLPRKQAAPVRSARRGQRYEIACSECYTDFYFNQNSSQTSVTCPECLHVGNVAPKDVMSKIAIAKSSEAGNLVKAVFPAILFFLCGLSWITLLNTQEAMGPALNYGLLGGTLIFFILATAMAMKYESNRHEVYF